MANTSGQNQDTDLVYTKYVFCSSPRVQKVGTNFVVHNHKQVEELYKDYKEKYLKWNLPLIFQ